MSAHVAVGGEDAMLELLEPGNDNQRAPSWARERRRLRELFEQLPGVEQDVLRLAMAGQTLSAIAGELGAPQSTVRFRLGRARARLQARAKLPTAADVERELVSVLTAPQRAAFVAVLEHGYFRAAAAELGVSRYRVRRIMLAVQQRLRARSAARYRPFQRAVALLLTGRRARSVCRQGVTGGALLVGSLGR